MKPNNVSRGSVNGDLGGSATAGLVACGGNIQEFRRLDEMRALAPLPRDAQELIDRAVIRVGRSRLVLADDLRSEGLIYPLPNWISVLTIYNERVGRAGHAKRTMIPDARGERQIMDRDGYTIPVYATWDDFSFDVRTLGAAERVGSPLDTSHAEEATRNVNEAVEDQGWNGIGINIDGNAAPGILTHPDINTFAYKDNEAWTASGHSGEDIFEDVQGMAEIADGDNYPGPYNLYVPTNYGFKLNEDYKANSDKTILQRLQELEFGGRPLRVRVAPELPANRTALVQMTSNVLDLVDGQRPAQVSWMSNDSFRRFYLILACEIVRIKSDYEGKSGIVAGNLT